MAQVCVTHADWAPELCAFGLACSKVACSLTQAGLLRIPRICESHRES